MPNNLGYWQDQIISATVSPWALLVAPSSWAVSASHLVVMACIGGRGAQQPGIFFEVSSGDPWVHYPQQVGLGHNRHQGCKSLCLGLQQPSANQPEAWISEEGSSAQPLEQLVLHDLWCSPLCQKIGHKEVRHKVTQPIKNCLSPRVCLFSQ